MKKSTRQEEILRASKAIRGLERTTHFANGGTVAGWRGRKSATTDRKKQESRRACRGRVSR